MVEAQPPNLNFHLKLRLAGIKGLATKSLWTWIVGNLGIGNLPFVADASTITIGLATPGSGQTAPTGCQFDNDQGTLLKLTDMALGSFGYTGADYFNTGDNFKVQAHIEYWID